VSTPAGTATAFLGAVLIVLGLALLAETAYFWHTHTAEEEPASPGRTPDLSKAPLSRVLGAKTEEEREYWTRREEKERREEIEQGHRDILWLRIRLYGCVPGGLLLILAGSWLVTTGPRGRLD
jgi:hypothetical protein